jgi:hypothetical protein
MSLRNTLKATVARCAPLDAQHATTQEASATSTATDAQQEAAIPHGIRVHSATVIATAMQQGRKGSATTVNPDEKLRVALPSTRNTQHGALTRHRFIAKLIEEAMKVCDFHGDGEAARADMRQQCLELPPVMQADLLAYFKGERPFQPEH